MIADVIDFVSIARFIFYRRIGKHVLYTGDDVVDVGKVAVHVAVVINLNGFPIADLIGKLEISHVRTAVRTINGKEAQARRRNPIEMAVGISHKLVRFLRRCIEADRVIDVIRRRKRRLFLIAIDRRTGGEQQVSNLMVPASFEDIEEADDIRIDIRPRMVDTVADAGLSG